MKKNLIFVCILFIGLSGFAKSVCYSSKELIGVVEMVQKFSHGQDSEAIKLFDAFCKNNSDKVTCSKTTVANDKVKQSTSEIMKGKGCGQLSQIANKDNTTTLYFFDSKRK